MRSVLFHNGDEADLASMDRRPLDKQATENEFVPLLTIKRWLGTFSARPSALGRLVVLFL